MLTTAEKKKRFFLTPFLGIYTASLSSEPNTKAHLETGQSEFNVNARHMESTQVGLAHTDVFCCIALNVKTHIAIITCNRDFLF